MKKVGICIGAIAAYWAMFFFGPALVMLINNIGYYLGGGGWRPDGLMYNVLLFLSQPIACGLAYFAAKGVCKNEPSICVLTNCIVGVCLAVLLTFTTTIGIKTAAMAVSAIVCVVTAVVEAREIKPGKTT